MSQGNAAGRARCGRAMAAIAALCAWAGMASGAAAAEAKGEVLAKVKALAQSASVACTVRDAARIQSFGMGGGGGGRRGGEGGGDERTSPTYYEAACAEGMGFVFVVPPKLQSAAASTAAPAPDYLNCLEAKAAADGGSFPAECRLKANADPVAGLRLFVAKLAMPCQIKTARALGHADSNSFFEIACQPAPAAAPKTSGASGFLLVTDRAMAANKPAAAIPCFDTESTPKLRCTLTRVDAVIDGLRRFVVQAAPACAPVAERLAGTNAAGDQVFEVRCRNGDGYLARRKDESAFSDLLACTDASAAGVCRLPPGPPHS